MFKAKSFFYFLLSIWHHKINRQACQNDYNNNYERGPKHFLKQIHSSKI